MALTAVEQLEIIETSIPSLTKPLEDVTLQVAFSFCVAFQNAQPDTSADELAGAYLQKMLGIIRGILRRDRKIANQITRLLIAVLGETVVDYATVIGATENQVLTFFENNIDDAVEIAATVTPAERAAYQALLP